MLSLADLWSGLLSCLEKFERVRNGVHYDI